MTLEGLVTVVAVLVVLGVVLYLIETYVPMAAPIKTVIRIIAVLALVLYLLSLIGLRLG